METENHQTKDILTITPNGLVNSFRTKNDNDDLSVYFGYKSPDDEIVSNYKWLYIIYIGWKNRLLFTYYYC